MIYGYIRVSTKEQKEDRQLIALSNSGYDFDRIFTDKESGKNFDRTQYKKMLACLHKGDIIVVKSIDRLGRNYNEITKEWQKITKTKHVDIIVLDMPLLDTTRSKDLLGTFISDLVLQLLSYVAENERINIRQRQAEGIAAAKAKGIHFGRPVRFRPGDYDNVLELYILKKIDKKQAQKIIGCSENTFYKLKKEYQNRIKNVH